MIYFKWTISYCALEIRNIGASLLNKAFEVLGSNSRSSGVFNSLPWERHEVVLIDEAGGGSKLGEEKMYGVPDVSFTALLL